MHRKSDTDKKEERKIMRKIVGLKVSEEGYRFHSTKPQKTCPTQHQASENEGYNSTDTLADPVIRVHTTGQVNDTMDRSHIKIDVGKSQIDPIVIEDGNIYRKIYGMSQTEVPNNQGPYGMKEER